MGHYDDFKDKTHILKNRDALGLSNSAKDRNCLKCDKPFPSEGIWHRICDHCKHLNSLLGSHYDEAITAGPAKRTSPKD